MSGAGFERLAAWTPAWAESLWRASWQGGIALALAWAACRLFPRLDPRARCWLWRLAYLKLLVTFFWTTPVAVPALPPASFPAGVSDRLKTADWRSALAARDADLPNLQSPISNLQPSTPERAPPSTPLRL